MLGWVVVLRKAPAVTKYLEGCLQHPRGRGMAETSRTANGSDPRMSHEFITVHVDLWLPKDANPCISLSPTRRRSSGPVSTNALASGSVAA